MSSLTANWVLCKSDEVAVDRGCYFDIKAADRVRLFFSKFLRHSKGEFANKPFELLEWQWRRVIGPAFGWRMPDGTRRFRKVGLGVAKKNGKSALLSGISLYMLTADEEPGAEIYSAAADRDQASIIYNEAAHMVESSPALLKRLRVRRSGKRIEFKAKRSFYRALSAEANTKEGFNIHGLLFDELHAQKTRDLWDTLRYGGRARRQPMFWWISTAGEADDTLLWVDEWRQARQIQESQAVNISYLGVIFEAAKEDDPYAEATWRKANPSYGITVQPRQIEEEAQAAKINPAEKMAFLRYTLNIATVAESEWISPEYWHACKEEFSLASLRDAECYGGLDLSSTTDLIAYVLVFKKKDLVYLMPYFWVPSREVQYREQQNKQRYKQWVEAGYLVETSNEPVADYGVITRDVLKICRKVPTHKVLVDKWNATQMAYNLRKKLRRSGLSTKLEFANFNFRTTSAATKELERLILSRRLRHPGHPVLDWMFSNVIITQDALGNRRPDRANSKDKIDGIAAAVLSLAVMMEEQRQKSKYENQGLANGSEDKA